MTPDGLRPDDPHRRQRELLGSYALGHLPAAEADAVRAHVDGCASCRAELPGLVEVGRALAGVDLTLVSSPQAPPPGLGKEILAAVEREHVLRSRRATRQRVLAAAAAVVTATALLGAGYALGNTGDSSTAPVALPGPSSSPSPTPLPTPVPTTQPSPSSTPAPVVPKEPVQLAALGDGVRVLEAFLVPHGWGVEVKFMASGLRQGEVFRASYVVQGGGSRPAGQFLGTGGKTIRCDLQGAVLRKDLVGVIIRDSADRRVLMARIPTLTG